MSGDLTALVGLIEAFDATLIELDPDDLGGHAVAYAVAGWEVFPLHPWNCRCRGPQGCGQLVKHRGKRPLTQHGVLDATCDLDAVAAWWTRWPTANIGGRVPSGAVVVDIDPRNGGNTTWTLLVAEHGDAATRTALSGRGEGEHRYYSHPGGRLRAKIGEGVDVKSHGGLVVLPPSLHAATGRPYRWHNPAQPIMPAPTWLATLLRRTPTPPRVASSRPHTYDGDSIADWYTATRTWADVLTPHGWKLVAGNGDDDGSMWRHPTATSAESASIRHDCLFVYSPNTPLEVTEAENPRGYTRFRAYAVLDHGGDLSAAARAAREMRGAAA